jgi:hypothetical protein
LQAKTGHGAKEGRTARRMLRGQRGKRRGHGVFGRAGRR